MKFFVLICSISINLAFANSEIVAADNEATIENEESTTIEKDLLNTSKPWSLRVGYKNQTWKNDDNEYNMESLHGDGVNINFGHMFDLGSQFTATPAIDGSYVTQDKKDYQVLFEDSTSGKVYNYEIGLSQRVSYNIPSGSVVIRPFFEGSAHIGKHNISDITYQNVYYDPEFDEIYDRTGTFEGSVNYRNYGISLGVEVMLENGIVPFFKYQISKTKFSRFKAQTKSDLIINDDAAYSYSEDLDLEFIDSVTENSLIAGLGLNF